MASSRNKSYGTSLCTCRNTPPTPSSSSLSSTSTSAFASSSASSFTSRSSSTLLARSASPPRVNIMYNKNSTNQSSSPSSPSLRISMIDRSTSPNRLISINNRRHTSNGNVNAVSYNKKRTCACSPTHHPGSYRCAFHKAMMMRNSNSNQTTSSSSYNHHSSSRLNFRRSAMTNSLVRIGGVEGELVKRALSALIRPSSHQLRRRAAFEPRPSRLSIMSTS